MQLPMVLLNAYDMAGSFDFRPGRRYCHKADTHRYYIYVYKSVCPSFGEWPDLPKCLNAEFGGRALWVREQQSGCSMSEAIKNTWAEMAAPWNWQGPCVVAQYTRLQSGEADGEEPSEMASRETPNAPAKRKPAAKSRSPSLASTTGGSPSTVATTARSGGAPCAAWSLGKECGHGYICAKPNSLHMCNHITGAVTLGHAHRSCQVFPLPAQ